MPKLCDFARRIIARVQAPQFKAHYDPSPTCDAPGAGVAWTRQGLLSTATLAFQFLERARPVIFQES